VPSPSTSIDLQGHLSYLSENKCSLLFQFLTESPGDVTKDDIADDIELPLTVISGTINVSLSVSKIYSTYNIRRQSQRSEVMLFVLSYSTGRTYVMLSATFRR